MMMGPSENDLLAQQNGFKSAAEMLAWHRQKDLLKGQAIVIPGQSTPAQLARQRQIQAQQGQPRSWGDAIGSFTKQITDALSRR